MNQAEMKVICSRAGLANKNNWKNRDYLAQRCSYGWKNVI